MFFFLNIINSQTKESAVNVMGFMVICLWLLLNAFFLQKQMVVVSKRASRREMNLCFNSPFCSRFWMLSSAPWLISLYIADRNHRPVCPLPCATTGLSPVSRLRSRGCGVVSTSHWGCSWLLRSLGVQKRNR